MKLSVIIVSYNVRYFLEQCLHSVIQASEHIDSEIFVVDNASFDGSAEMVRNKFPKVKLLVNSSNLGFSKANNQAIRQSEGEYILLLNPDTVVPKDTFSKVLDFIKHHPDAGAVGVKMLDGKGRFLPESKRGLPTPLVAFYKLSGLSRLFPKSRVFNQYSLGYLAEYQIHEVDVVAGAFMLMKKEALVKTGLLDEDFFMYGEDIDLSYRLQQTGYRNYYFPEAQIIHFKGESTRKEDIDNLSNFNKAMLIFARKHFTSHKISWLSFCINIAIFFSTCINVVKKVIKVLYLPFLDAIITFAGFHIAYSFWERKVIYPGGGHFPDLFYNVIIPTICLVIVTSVFLTGGYKQPVSFRKVIFGIASGTILTLSAYSLFPETLRFSRAIIILGILWTFIALPLYRYFLSLGRFRWFQSKNQKNKRFLVVAKEDEAERVSKILKQTFSPYVFVKYVSVEDGTYNSDLFVGQLADICEIIKICQTDEVIFCARDVSTYNIISTMLSLKEKHVNFKIAPPEGDSIIGSNSAKDRGELYVIDVHK